MDNPDQPVSAELLVSNAALLGVLQHSLGLDQYGNGSRYRNHFCAGPGSSDFKLCAQATELGLMVARGPRAITGGDHLFSVTTAGDEFIAQHSPIPPKLTRGQRRYRAYLAVADCFESFGHWLKWTASQKNLGSAANHHQN